MVRYLVLCVTIMMSGAALAADAVEAAASCVVIHEKDGVPKETTTTCFENIALERTSFESGVCRWESESQSAADVQTTTRFVPSCPASYSGYCDRLVMNPRMVAPVKIFIYDRSAEVMDRARKQCLSGGGKWTVNSSESE